MTILGGKNKIKTTLVKKNIKKIILQLEKLNAFLLDALFPIACLVCQKKNVWICDECLNKLTLLSFQVCPYCEKEITQSGLACERCKQNQFAKNAQLPLNALVCATDYNKISKLVHFFKYNFVISLGMPLGKIVTRALQKNDLPLPDLIIPIPIHRNKLKWRGFNQAEVLAKAVGQNITPGFPIPVRTDLVFRRRKTRTQMKIKTYQERLDNLRDAFEIEPEAKNIISGKKILLIDDIATTGATLFECAKILKSAGAKKIYGAIIARQKI